jgi:hypothetical protein
LRRLVIVGDSAKRPARRGLLEEDPQRHDEKPGDERGHRVFHVHEQPALERSVEDDLRFLGHADVERVDVASPDRLAEPIEEVRHAERCHEEDDAFLVHERAQHQALDEPCQHHHDREREGERGDERHLLHEPHERERGEEHHRALREIEDARGLEDEHEADGDEGVENAGHQSAQHDLEPLAEFRVPEHHRRDGARDEQHEEGRREVALGCRHQCFTPR